MIIKTQSLSLMHSFGSNKKLKKGFLFGTMLQDKNTPAKKRRSFIDYLPISEGRVHDGGSIITPCEIDIRQL
jgi:hypothetical protein